MSEYERLIDWLEDALSRNQIVHPSDRALARGFVERARASSLEADVETTFKLPRNVTGVKIAAIPDVTPLERDDEELDNDES